MVRSYCLRFGQDATAELWAMRVQADTLVVEETMAKGQPKEFNYRVETINAGSFVIEMTHRKTGDKKYIGSVPMDDDNEPVFLNGKPVETFSFSNEFFETFEEASRYPFDSQEAAEAVVFSLPKTKNIDFAVVEAFKGK
jgi:hypothetical protein